MNTNNNTGEVADLEVKRNKRKEYYKNNKDKWTNSKFRKRNREWREKNSARLKEYNSEWSRKNREYVSRKHKEYVDGHRDQVNANSRRWYSRNRGAAKPYDPLESKRRKQQIQQRLSNGQCVNCSNQRLANSSRMCEKCWYRSSIRSSLGSAAGQSWEYFMQEMALQENKCPYTGRALIPALNASLDHIIPKSVNPDLATNIDNLEWVDMSINIAKNDMTKEQFIAMCFEVVDYQIRLSASVGK